MASNVALVLGAGPNAGAAIVRKLSGAGYQVAAVSRSISDDKEDGILNISGDMSKPAQIPGIFATVRQKLGAFPSVVVYHCASLTPPPDGDNMFSVPLTSLETDLAIMVASPFVAAGECFKAWAEDKTGSKKTFIMTGNRMPRQVAPMTFFTTLGVGKSGAAYWVQEADLLYKAKGWRFFFADERTAEGKSVGHITGAESHASLYLQLAQGDSDDLPSWVTFTDGKYQKFD